MWRVACIACLLLPLAAAAQTPSGTMGSHGKAPEPPHRWPVAAAAQSPTPAAQLAPANDATALKSAVHALQRYEMQPPPPPRSVAHVRLSRRVRLAMLTYPRWSTMPHSPPTLSASLFSLRC